MDQACAARTNYGMDMIWQPSTRNEQNTSFRSLDKYFSRRFWRRDARTPSCTTSEKQKSRLFLHVKDPEMQDRTHIL